MDILTGLAVRRLFFGGGIKSAFNFRFKRFQRKCVDGIVSEGGMTNETKKPPKAADTNQQQ